LLLELVGGERLPRGDASPVHTKAVGELYAEVLYKVAHAIKDTEKVRQRVAV
jgi:hypothetical protein